MLLVVQHRNIDSPGLGCDYVMDDSVDDEVMIPDILPLTGSDIYQFLENTVQNCAGENTSDIFQVRP